MRSSVLIENFFGLGASLSLASRSIAAHPTVALTAGLAVLLFSAYAVARPR